MEYKTSGRVSDHNVRARGGEYSEALHRASHDDLYTLPESSLRIPFDEPLFEASRTLAKTVVGPKLSHILHIGIGGSNLGARALYEVIKGTSSFRVPTMLFLDTCAPELIANTSEILLREVSEKEEILIIIASKSGTTTETIVNASVLIAALENKLGPLAERIVCITDEHSGLWSIAKENKYHCLSVPKIVGGRDSVCAPMGMFPLLCLGVDGEAFLRGARRVVDDCVERRGESDAFRFANDIYSWQAKGTFVFDFFAFHPELEAMGKWYRQLFAESLGKAVTINGEATTHHIVPSVSIGSTDLHSAEQLYMAQPQISARIFVRVAGRKEEQRQVVPGGALISLVENIKGRTPAEIMNAIYAGVVEAYRVRNISFSELALDNLEPEALGALMQFFMCGTMYLADMLKVNAFDQPDVEVYKKNMKNILDNKGE